ncbi:LysR family transcriptional regulator [Pseudoalteromonas sp. BZB3]|uniref:LysR family transcriptional regulator n=1 Tax=Pseudoalteromonas sp. BZB3 TaxID=3136670 RepID=UPI0032C48A3F
MDWLSAVNSFELVAKTNSFTSAAEQQGISASAVSKRIDWLEKQLATSLFVRTTRQVSLTESGQGFLQNAAPWLEQFDAMLESVKSAHEEP